MHITIINDCRDDNAAGRQMARAGTLADASVSFVGVGSYGDLEAAGNLIDILDAYGGRPGAILVNVAPRHKGEGENGTPFGYFWHEKTLVVSTLRGLTLSLAKKFEIANELFEFDIEEASIEMADAGFITREEGDRIAQSQFRSFDFMPRAAAFMLAGNQLARKARAISDIPDAPASVWWVDNFGNCKTTLLPEEVDFEEGKSVLTGFGSFPCVRQLKSVPEDTAALVIGSSGIGGRRFVEIMAQGRSAAEMFSIVPGKELDMVLA